MAVFCGAYPYGQNWDRNGWISGMFVLLFCGIFANQSTAEEVLPLPRLVEVISSDAHPILVQSLRAKEFRIDTYNLDDVRRMENRYRERLISVENNVEASKLFLRELIVGKGKEGAFDLQRDAQAAYKGISLGGKYGINRIPAVVFDAGKSVIYGVTDVDKAIVMYGKWRKEHPEYSPAETPGPYPEWWEKAGRPARSVQDQLEAREKEALDLLK